MSQLILFLVMTGKYISLWTTILFVSSASKIKEFSQNSKHLTLKNLNCFVLSNLEAKLVLKDLP